MTVMTSNNDKDSKKIHKVEQDMEQTLAAPAETGTVQITEDQIADLLEKEWLLTNSRGSYASGTVIGCNTRRYHGLLVASLHPPVERTVMLSNVLDTIEFDGESDELANFEFSDRLHPQGYRYLKEFRRDTGVHFTYQIGSLELERSIYLGYDDDTMVITYRLAGFQGKVTLNLVPLVALRDFHSMQSSSSSLHVEHEDCVMTARVLDPNGPAVHLYCKDAVIDRGPDWWYAMRYRVESRRGQHDHEDVWAPGTFTVTATSPCRIDFVVRATRGLERPGPLDIDVDELIDSLRHRNAKLLEQAGAADRDEEALVKAADQFIVRRQVAPGQESASILAGYHWFADWGRDTFIALPGLLLDTGRFAEAREVLTTFGDVLDEGMIPNRFDDYGGEPHYNSVDASLWYINAAYEYLRASGEDAAFDESFRPVIARIVAAYSRGTRDIRGDDDGLIIAGNEDTQLTWMDAKCNDVVFTPRYGKAVEINALWFNALNILAETAPSDGERDEYAAMAKKVQTSFRSLFWNKEHDCLYDCILTDGTPDASIRPNQIFAVSLPFSCLSLARQKKVVAVVKEELLTPYGLRSLSPADSRYQGHYEGDQFQRDSAYHQGTTWAFLMGPFIEAHLRVHGFSKLAKREAADIIAPLLRHLHTEACLGSVSEIIDGDFPHRPKGCIAQAWSVAALLRAKRLINQ